MPRSSSSSHSYIDSARKLQKQMAEKVIARDKFHAATAIKRACGVDVSYSGRVAYCSAAVVEAEKMELVELATHKSKATYPYIPGLFFLREAQPALDTLKKLKGGFDLLLVDGHGVLHPRRCGLASYLGVALDVPLALLYDLRDGKVVRIQSFTDPEEAQRVTGLGG